MQAAETACTDGLDNDGDFKTDCADADCALDAACVVTVTRHFDVIRDVPSQPITSWRNIYLIDWPENIGLRDVGSSTAVGNRCVGDPGSAATPDGVIDSTDAICTLWTSREGTFFLSRFDAGTCQFSVQTATKGPSIAFGGLPFPILPGQSYVVAVSTGSISSLPRNPGILAGSCDETWPGQRVEVPASGCRPAYIPLHLPWDSVARTADEILCGIGGVDWVDANADGDPDSCTAGLFDGTSTLTVFTWDNDPLTNPATDNRVIRRTVTRTSLGLAFLGASFTLAPGDGCFLQVRNTQAPKIWNPLRGGTCR